VLPFTVTNELSHRVISRISPWRTSFPPPRKQNKYPLHSTQKANSCQELAHILLVELLAYQFASPVRWIETQDVIFDASMNVERLIEIGPSPTLAGMANRTLKAKYEGYDQALGMQRQVLAYSKEGKEIYYNVDPLVPVEEEKPTPKETSAPAAAPAPVAVIAAPAPAAAPTGPAAQIPDEPVSAVDIVHAVVAQKLKKSLEEISKSKAIKDLVGGKSTLQVSLPCVLC
jgi:fatty acid synthase subunit alpha, fungi type